MLCEHQSPRPDEQTSAADSEEIKLLPKIVLVIDWIVGHMDCRTDRTATVEKKLQ